MVRDEWLHLLSGELQRVIGLIEFQEYELGASSTARDLISRIPDPATPIEEQLLRGMLLDVSVRWAAKAHRHAHGGTAPACNFHAEMQRDDGWRLHADKSRTAKIVFEEWAILYFRALRRAHPAPVSDAARWIVEHSRERLTLRAIARAISVNSVVLRRDFKACFGLSVHRYHQRARLADTMRLLASGSHDVRSALYAAGWSSPKSLYRAAIDVTGMSLHLLRDLPPDECERRVALPQPRIHVN